MIWRKYPHILPDKGKKILALLKGGDNIISITVLDSGKLDYIQKWIYEDDIKNCKVGKYG